MYSGQVDNYAPKLERKYVEKNRRNKMKALFNQLYSLLPPHAVQEAMALPDQIDAAVNYLKNLEMKLEKRKVHLEELRRSKKRTYSCMENQNPSTATKLFPQIEVHEMSPTMDIILITGLGNVAMFYNIIRLLHEEAFEVINANFSLYGNSVLQIYHETKIMESPTMVYSRVKELLYGSCSSSVDDAVEILLRLWDYEIESEMLGFDITDLLPIGSS